MNLIDGKALREHIKKAGYTMKAFAKAVGISRRTLYCYVEGTKNPALHRLLRIAALLNLKTDELVSK